MSDKISKANRILEWMQKQCIKNRNSRVYVSGVRSEVLLAYLKRYHSDLTEWINDLSKADEQDNHVWIETGLLEQLVSLYMNVRKEWSKELQRYVAVEE